MGDGGLTPLYLLVYIKHILLTVRTATQQFAKNPIVCISFVRKTQ